MVACRIIDGFVQVNAKCLLDPISLVEVLERVIDPVRYCPSSRLRRIDIVRADVALVLLGDLHLLRECAIGRVQVHVCAVDAIRFAHGAADDVLVCICCRHEDARGPWLAKSAIHLVVIVVGEAGVVVHLRDSPVIIFIIVTKGRHGGRIVQVAGAVDQIARSHAVGCVVPHLVVRRDVTLHITPDQIMIKPVNGACFVFRLRLGIT